MHLSPTKVNPHAGLNWVSSSPAGFSQRGDEKGEVGEEVGEPWEVAERRVPAVASWVRRDVSRSNPVAHWFCVPCFLFLASPVFWPSGLWSYWLIFLVLLHPSVLQSVLGGWNHRAELWVSSILKNHFYNNSVHTLSSSVVSQGWNQEWADTPNTSPKYW